MAKPYPWRASWISRSLVPLGTSAAAAWTSSEVPAAALLFTTTISSTTSVEAKSTIAARIESRSLYVGKTTEMRLPRQDTSMSLPAEHPRDALFRDEALLDALLPGPVTHGTPMPETVAPGSARRDDAPGGRVRPGVTPLVRWWVASA